jgi:hypothetical protein
MRPEGDRKPGKRCGNEGGGPASDSRRTSQLLRLLPSGPDRVHNLLSRKTNGTTIEPQIMPQKPHAG